MAKNCFFSTCGRAIDVTERLVDFNLNKKNHKGRTKLHRPPLAGEANNLKSQSQQEGMWLEAQVNLYNMWTPIGKSVVKAFFEFISSLFTFRPKCKQ